MPRGSAGAAPGRRPRDDRRTGARAAGGEKKKKSGLFGLLVGLLALLAIVALILWLLGVFDSADKADGGGSSGRSALTASGTSLLPVPSSGLGAYVGQPATGKGLEVVKVNGNQGFSVGKSGSDPVYIEWGGDVGSNEASSFQPKKGQKVDLTGPVERAGAAEIGKLKLGAADAKLVSEQKAFVNADRVTASK